MTNNQKKLEELRAKAQLQMQSLENSEADFSKVSETDFKILLNELRLHQIELEIQIEELKVSRAAVESSEYRFRNLFESAPVGYCTLDEEEKIHRANSAFAEILGKKLFELRGNPFSNFVHPGSQDTFYHFQRKTPDKKHPLTSELQLIREDGMIIDTLISMNIVAEQTDKDNRLITITDLTHMRNIERQLLHSARFAAIGSMSAGIVEDIIGPLSIISKNVGTYLDHQQTAERATIIRSIVFRSVRKIARVVSSLNSFSNSIALGDRKNPSLGKIRKPILLYQAVREAIEITSVKSTRLKVFVELKGDQTSEVFGDENEIIQVFVTLLSNAIDAAANSEEKWVRLNFQAHDGKTGFIITDSGPPLSSEVQEHIFTPFFTNKPEGLGLALVVAKSILEDYKSELTLHSVTPNTSFQIMFHTPKISNA